LGKEEEGDSIEKRNGAEDEIGPKRAACDMPWLSKEFGKGASSTLRPCREGEPARWALPWGEPNGEGSANVSSGLKAGDIGC